MRQLLWSPAVLPSSASRTRRVGAAGGRLDPSRRVPPRRALASFVAALLGLSLGVLAQLGPSGGRGAYAADEPVAPPAADAPASPWSTPGGGAPAPKEETAVAKPPVQALVDPLRGSIPIGAGSDKLVPGELPLLRRDPERFSGLFQRAFELTIPEARQAKIADALTRLYRGQDASARRVFLELIDPYDSLLVHERTARGDTVADALQDFRLHLDKQMQAHAASDLHEVVARLLADGRVPAWHGSPSVSKLHTESYFEAVVALVALARNDVPRLTAGMRGAIQEQLAGEMSRRPAEDRRAANRVAATWWRVRERWREGAGARSDRLRFGAAHTVAKLATLTRTPGSPVAVSEAALPVAPRPKTRLELLALAERLRAKQSAFVAVHRLSLNPQYVHYLCKAFLEQPDAAASPADRRGAAHSE